MAVAARIRMLKDRTSRAFRVLKVLIFAIQDQMSGVILRRRISFRLSLACVIQYRCTVAEIPVTHLLFWFLRHSASSLPFFITKSF